MDAQQFILTAIDTCLRHYDEHKYSFISWDHALYVRDCKMRLQEGDSKAWEDFLKLLGANEMLTYSMVHLLAKIEVIRLDDSYRPMSLNPIPPNVHPFAENDEQRFLTVLDTWLRDRTQIVARPFGKPHYENANKFIPPTRQTAGEVMYVETKPGLTGEARIGRVRCSKTRKTLYYAGRKLQSLKGGYKANYYDVETGLRYWVSRCRKDGNDTLYPGVIEIDEDAREEYWTKIREAPENKHLTKTRSEGKHAKRRPS